MFEFYTVAYKIQDILFQARNPELHVLLYYILHILYILYIYTNKYLLYCFHDFVHPFISSSQHTLLYGANRSECRRRRPF